MRIGNVLALAMPKAYEPPPVEETLANLLEVLIHDQAQTTRHLVALMTQLEDIAGSLQPGFKPSPVQGSHQVSRHSLGSTTNHAGKYVRHLY